LANIAIAELERTLNQSYTQRSELTNEASSKASELGGLRSSIRDLTRSIQQLTTDVHRDEIARAEQRMRVEQVQARALEEFGVAPEELVAEYGPDVLVPPSATAPGDEVDPQAPPPEPYPYVRIEQEKRLRTAEKAVALLGRVNPLALEEFTAMEERYTFLNTQLEDLKSSRKDLLDIVAEVDERVQQVFAEAFADVQREFSEVFGRLFPGGEGRLVLTDPQDLLNTGIEVEARPAGKKVKRLSLLSGGERSLTAVAFLVSLFKARPSPFYLLDEVEAALDDVNLGRLIGLMEELRSSSQLLIITHQKRTMEIGDALYGVTMRGGVTQVISQRMRELVPS
jgi:chromosome segregation protein